MSATEIQPYQVMPDLSESDYAALRQDIQAHGVLVPIDVDESGRVLDGHNRKAICAELGVSCPERIVGRLADDEARKAYAVTVNCQRRHLNREQRRELTGRLRDEGWSIRKISGALGVDKSTTERDVSALRTVTPEEPEQPEQTPKQAAAAKRQRKSRAARKPERKSQPQGRTDPAGPLSKPARELLGHVAAALDGARRIRVWQDEHTLTPDEAQHIYGTDKPTEMFTALMTLAGGSGGQATWDQARKFARVMLGLPAE